MIKDVGELHRELYPDAFIYLDVLGKRRVHIPTAQAAKIAGAATAIRIKAENAATEHIENCRWVGKHVEALRVGGPYAV